MYSSEGSHGRFAPVGGLQCKLLKYVEDEIGECEVEHVCCGDGLARIYNFLCTELNTNEPMLDPAEVLLLTRNIDYKPKLLLFYYF